MGDEFKLPGTSYDELIKMIKAYGQAKESTLDEINKLCGISTYTISRNNGFLVAINIIEGGNQKVITDKGKELSRALQHNIDEEISRIWREIVNENNFLSKMITAIKIRNGMDPQSFQSHIAYSSGQKSNQYVKTGSATIIEIFKVAKLIEEADGKLVPQKEILNIDKPKPTETSIKEENITHMKEELISYPIANRSYGGISINIEIKVDAKLSEIDDLGVKLKKILSDISEYAYKDNIND